MTLDQVRHYALSLPSATEEPHFDRTSFRVRGKIFATAKPDGEELNLMFGELEATAIAQSQSSWCSLLHWGKRVAGVQVRLPDADPARVRELVLDAWRAKAPKALAAQLDRA